MCGNWNSCYHPEITTCSAFLYPGRVRVGDMRFGSYVKKTRGENALTSKLYKIILLKTIAIYLTQFAFASRSGKPGGLQRTGLDTPPGQIHTSSRARNSRLFPLNHYSQAFILPFENNLNFPHPYLTIYQIPAIHHRRRNEFTTIPIPLVQMAIQIPYMGPLVPFYLNQLLMNCVHDTGFYSPIPYPYDSGSPISLNANRFQINEHRDVSRDEGSLEDRDQVNSTFNGEPGRIISTISHENLLPNSSSSPAHSIRHDESFPKTFKDEKVYTPLIQAAADEDYNEIKNILTNIGIDKVDIKNTMQYLIQKSMINDDHQALESYIRICHCEEIGSDQIFEVAIRAFHSVRIPFYLCKLVFLAKQYNVKISQFPLEEDELMVVDKITSFIDELLETLFASETVFEGAKKSFELSNLFEKLSWYVEEMHYPRMRQRPDLSKPSESSENSEAGESSKSSENQESYETEKSSESDQSSDVNESEKRVKSKEFVNNYKSPRNSRVRKFKAAEEESEENEFSVYDDPIPSSEGSEVITNQRRFTIESTLDAQIPGSKSSSKLRRNLSKDHTVDFNPKSEEKSSKDGGAFEDLSGFHQGQETFDEHHLKIRLDKKFSIEELNGRLISFIEGKATELSYLDDLLAIWRFLYGNDFNQRLGKLLILAIKEDHSEFLKVILESGRSDFCNLIDDDLIIEKLLILATLENNTDCVKELVMFTCKYNYKLQSSICFSLFNALIVGNLSVFELLLPLTKDQIMKNCDIKKSFEMLVQHSITSIQKEWASQFS